MEVSKITLTPVVLVGDQVRFEIVVRNIGETVLNNVFVEEYSYDGLVYDSFVDNGLWTHSLINGKNVWTLNRNLDSKELVNLFVNFNTTMRGNFTNVVVAGSDKTENKTANNTTTVGPLADLAIEKTVSDGEPVFLTKNGYGSMVVMSIDAYSRLTQNVEQALDEADEFARNNRERMTHEEVFGQLRSQLNG